MTATNEVRIVDSGDSCPKLPIVLGGGVARAVIWPGIGAKERAMHRISLQAGDRTIVLNHPMEAVYYVIGGSGAVADPGVAETESLVKGSMVHVEPGTRYEFTAGEHGMELIGGPCPVDPAMYEGLES